MVKYLAWYVNNRKLCRRGSYKVKLHDEIEKFKTKNPGKKPIIVFDFLACIDLFITDHVEVLCAGRETECTRKAIKLCKTLKDLGCDLVFFMDGPLQEKKIPSWLGKVNIKYENHKKVFEAIQNNVPLRDINSTHILTSYNNNLISVIKEYGEFIICLSNECDLELAEYAYKNHAAGVFSGDSDFLIMPGDWPIWSPKCFNWVDFSTVAWNKRSLRDSLHLQQKQMLMFGCLAGNDYLLYEIVKPFLDDITKGEKGFSTLASYVRREFPEGFPARDKVDKLAKTLYAYHKDIAEADSMVKSVEHMRDLIYRSLNLFNYKRMSNFEVRPLWLKKHINETHSFIAYEFIKGAPPFLIRQNYIDLSKPDVRPYSEIVLPIVRRLMGIVLYDQREEENVSRTIMLKPSHDEPFQRESITPIFPPKDLEIPYLVDLFGYGQNQVEEEKKFEILSWAIASGRRKLKSSNLMEIRDSIYFIPALVLNYLFKANQITTEEADVILLVISEASKASDEKMMNLTAPEATQERPFWLASVFVQIVFYFRSALVVCGLFKYSQRDHFDGFIFHKMYPKYLTMDLEECKKLLEPIQKYRLYVK